MTVSWVSPSPCICTDEAHQNRCMPSHSDCVYNQRLKPDGGGTTIRVLVQLLVISRFLGSGQRFDLC